MKELSIIIPVYNVENFIAECLNSIISQTYDNFECIIVDDCSPDRSADIASDIINHYQGNIEFKLLHHDTNKGPSAARNIGIQQSTTDYVFFLDSDDRLYPNSIETLVNELKRHPNADIIDGEVFTEGDASPLSDLPSSICGEKMLYKYLMDSKIIPRVWNQLIKKEIIINHQVFFKEGILFEDLLWCYYFYRYVEEYYRVKQYTYFYRTSNSNSIMREASKKFDKPARSFIIVMKELIKDIDYSLYPQNIVFILSKLMPIVYNANKMGIEDDTKKLLHQLKKELLVRHLKEFRPLEVIYELHLFLPLSHLLNLGYYRHQVLYKYCSLIKLYYKILGAFYA